MKQGVWSVRAKLSLTFGALATLVLVVAGLSLFNLNAANERFRSLVEGVNARATTAAQVRQAVDERAVAARNLVLVTRAVDLEAEKAEVERAHEEVKSHLDRLNALAAEADDMSEQARGLIARIGDIEARYGPVALGIVSLALQGQHDAAIARMNDECRPLLAALIQATDEYAG